MDESLQRGAGALLLVRSGVALLLLAGCAGGGGGGDDDGDGTPPETRIEFSIGGPQATLAQQPLAITLAPAVSLRAAALRPDPQADPAERFAFPPGPDETGRTLPRIGGRFDTLTQSYDGALDSRLWLDLPASAGAYKLAVAVSTIVRGSGALSDGEPSAGELWITPRETYADLPGRLRLRFTTGATPVCIGWDREADGSVDVEQCTTFAAFAAWWHAPEGGLALPAPLQRAASAGHAGWSRLYAQFDISVGALQMAESQHEALLAAAAGAEAAVVTCGIAVPGEAPGRIVLRWLDRNGSGRFDTGDDVRFDVQRCWNAPDGAAGAGRLFDGAYELRAYERQVGAAPTFVGLTITDTIDVGGVATPQASETVDGGFSLRAPGITASGSEIAGYPFDAGNLLAAGSVAARSMDFYPDVGDLAFAMLDAARTSAAARDLGLCRNAGAATLAVTDALPAGLSAGDTVTLTLSGCDIGNGTIDKRMDGTLRLAVQAWLPGTAPDWEVRADARLDLQRSGSGGTLQRRGEFGISVAYVLGHSMLVSFRPEGWGSVGLSGGGVLSGVRNGALAYQIGCYAAAYYRGTWVDADYQLLPNQVVKTANRVFTIGMRQGEAFIFKHGSDGMPYPDVAVAGLSPISAPECVPLGVPITGVGGGDTNVQFDAWPAGDGDHVRLGLYERSGTLLNEQITRWADLVR